MRLTKIALAALLMASVSVAVAATPSQPPATPGPLAFVYREVALKQRAESL